MKNVTFNDVIIQKDGSLLHYDYDKDIVYRMKKETIKLDDPSITKEEVSELLYNDPTRKETKDTLLKEHKQRRKAREEEQKRRDKENAEIVKKHSEKPSDHNTV